MHTNKTNLYSSLDLLNSVVNTISNIMSEANGITVPSDLSSTKSFLEEIKNALSSAHSVLSTLTEDVNGAINSLLSLGVWSEDSWSELDQSLFNKYSNKSLKPNNLSEDEQDILLKLVTNKVANGNNISSELASLKASLCDKYGEDEINRVIQEQTDKNFSTGTLNAVGDDKVRLYLDSTSEQTLLTSLEVSAHADDFKKLVTAAISGNKSSEIKALEEEYKNKYGLADYKKFIEEQVNLNAQNNTMGISGEYAVRLYGYNTPITSEVTNIDTNNNKTSFNYNVTINELNENEKQDIQKIVLESIKYGTNKLPEATQKLKDNYINVYGLSAISSIIQEQIDTNYAKGTTNDYGDYQVRLYYDSNDKTYQESYIPKTKEEEKLVTEEVNVAPIETIEPETIDVKKEVITEPEVFLDSEPAVITNEIPRAVVGSNNADIEKFIKNVTSSSIQEDALDDKNATNKNKIVEEPVLINKDSSILSSDISSNNEEDDYRKWYDRIIELTKENGGNYNDALLKVKDEIGQENYNRLTNYMSNNSFYKAPVREEIIIPETKPEDLEKLHNVYKGYLEKNNNDETQAQKDFIENEGSAKLQVLSNHGLVDYKKSPKEHDNSNVVKEYFEQIGKVLSSSNNKKEL